MMRTPWGPAQEVRQLEPGILDVHTPGHGGLKIDGTAWERLPADVRPTFMNRGWAEEDLEMGIALVLLGFPGQQADRHERILEAALSAARNYPRYAPALPHLESFARARAEADGESLDNLEAAAAILEGR